MSEYFERLLENPTNFCQERYDLAFTLTREQIDTLHLEGARKRFRELMPKLTVVRRLAEDQNIASIDRIEDFAPLMFAHTVYKSYPMSYLERGRFDKMTQWLQGLTTFDLSNVDASGVETIDDWVDLLDAETPIKIQHTSGTTGKLSFVPRSKEQWVQTMTLSAGVMKDWRGLDSGPNILRDGIPIIIPGYRYGASATQRGNDMQVEMFAKGEENSLFLYPNARFSADVASLAGRLRAAEARGEAGIGQIPQVLLDRREQLLELERTRAQDIENFFNEALERFAGKDVYIAAMWAVLYDWCEEGMKRGLKEIFGKKSVLLTGGGAKGTPLPDNWRERVQEFLGFDGIYELYGCSELIPFSMKCEHDHYHLPPVVIPFILDPKTGEVQKLTDGVKGRLAMFDLTADSYWGGIVTGDEIALGGFEKPCACGRNGAYVMPPIRRYSEIEGGDDRVVCAGAPEAHDRALEFLAELAQ